MIARQATVRFGVDVQSKNFFFVCTGATHRRFFIELIQQIIHLPKYIITFVS